MKQRRQKFIDKSLNGNRKREGTKTAGDQEEEPGTSRQDMWEQKEKKMGSVYMRK